MALPYEKYKGKNGEYSSGYFYLDEGSINKDGYYSNSNFGKVTDRYESPNGNIIWTYDSDDYWDFSLDTAGGDEQILALSSVCSQIKNAYITPDEILRAYEYAYDYTEVDRLEARNMKVFQTVMEKIDVGKQFSFSLGGIDQFKINSCLNNGGRVIFLVRDGVELYDINGINAMSDEEKTGLKFFIIYNKDNNNIYNCCDIYGQIRTSSSNLRSVMLYSYKKFVDAAYVSEVFYIQNAQTENPDSDDDDDTNPDGGDTGSGGEDTGDGDGGDTGEEEGSGGDTGSESETGTGTTSLIWPTKGKQITSGFGMRSSGFHEGIDIAPLVAGISDGEDIVSVCDGMIVQASDTGNGYGKCVKIQSSNGLIFLYGHLSEIASGITVRTEVSQGDKLGVMGTTGYSTGVHLHFHIQVNETFVNDNNITKMSDSTQGGSTAGANVNNSVCYYTKNNQYFVNPLPYLNSGAISGSANGNSANLPYSNMIDEAFKSDISEFLDEQIAALREMGIEATIEGTYLKMDFSATLKDVVKYTNVHKLQGIQVNPNAITRKNFKQDYVVIIRKKLYFAATMTSEENYLRMYQINNFSTINTSHDVKGNASCTVQIKGGERVTCIDNTQEKGANWESYEHILNGLTNIDDEGKTDGSKWRIGTSDWNDPSAAGVDFKNLMDAKEAKYGWRFAEKCDWEPMDEITVFSKSRTEKYENGQYKFKKIFFGYINKVQKTYKAGADGLTIMITANDQVKLLEYSYVNQSPTYLPGRYNNGMLDISFDTDQFGAFKLNEPLVLGLKTLDDEAREIIIRHYLSENIFYGLYPDLIIKNCCAAAGIPDKYLQTRIEPVKCVPYLYKLKQSGLDFFSASFDTRLKYCKEIADICFMEFFGDEEGNIVFKIPSYVLGNNYLTTNNCGYEIDESLRSNIGKKFSKTMQLETISQYCNLVTPRVYAVTEGETIRSIAKKFFNNERYASEIQVLNIGNLQHYSTNSKLKPMNILILQHDVNDLNARREYRQLMGNGEVTRFANQLYNIDSGINDFLETETITMSMLTDDLIIEIPIDEIIGFTMTDDGEQIYNSVDINGQTFMGVYDNSTELKIKRTVPQIESILRFGVRVASPQNTPFVQDEKSAEMFGNMIILKSAASRFTADLDMIENPDIKVGTPVRFFTYDEHPQQETGLFSENKWMAQSIYYIDSIKRSIKVDGVSTMSLQLSAGRMMGQESIYDIMYTIYEDFYTEPDNIDKIKAAGYFNDAYNQYFGSSSGQDEITPEPIEGTTIEIPEMDSNGNIRIGTSFAIMAWSCITNTSSRQSQLRQKAYPDWTESYTECYDEDGMAKINGRYVVAVTDTFGTVGDYIDAYLDNGHILYCIIGDIKNEDDPGCTKWGHTNGQCVLEFVVREDMWYEGGGAAPGKSSAASAKEALKGARVVKIVVGPNYFDL